MLAQEHADGWRLRTAIQGFFPRLGALTGRPRWTGFLYGDDRGDLSPHLRSRAETARRLAAGPGPVTTIRSAVVVGGGSAAFETIVALVDRLPAMICPRWVTTKTQPIALADVVRYLAGPGGRGEAWGRRTTRPGRR